jgi:hypothetical protein
MAGTSFGKPDIFKETLLFSFSLSSFEIFVDAIEGSKNLVQQL